MAEVKELAAAQAADYAEDPSILAKKTIMLIERLRRKMGHNIGGHSKTTKKSNYWLGPKVFDFLSTQLSEWAKSLDIIDSNFGTLSYTAADFYHDLPAEERERVEVVTVLNKRTFLICVVLRIRAGSTLLPFSNPTVVMTLNSGLPATIDSDYPAVSSTELVYQIPQNGAFVPH